MRILRELIEIRKELQNIRVILQSQFVHDYRIERKRVDGKIVRTIHTLQDPLKELRKRYNIDH
jgi:hypothetical protein